ncbi:MAG: hypothetical protein EXS03_01060 [Phycisphaerales bacterium]|nr:hypothetical protein [Phycisphaerales bacterium]
MREFELRGDITRAEIEGYKFPLGIEPVSLPAPKQGFTLEYTPGEDGDPDTYAFHVVVSHDRLKPILEDAFELLPEEVVPIVEIGSRDAYRALDVYIGSEPIPTSEFLESWRQFEAILLEDGSIGAGGNAEEPFVEVFLDTWKGLLINVPIGMRREVERLLARHGLREVLETWPQDLERSPEPPSQLREVLVTEDDQSPDLDEILLQLREFWGLELDVDPEVNVDESGRRLGMVLWHAIVLASREGKQSKGAYLTFWATASNLSEMERLVGDYVDARLPEWQVDGFFSVDRVAFDERPDELSDLVPRRSESEIHIASVDEW